MCDREEMECYERGDDCTTREARGVYATMTGGCDTPMYPAYSDAIMKQTTEPCPSYIPKNREIQTLPPNSELVIIQIDDTGSMGDFPRVLHKDLPDIVNKFRKDVSFKKPYICICTVGDIDYDKAAVQVSDLINPLDENIGELDMHGLDKMDNILKKLCIQGGGGDQAESYECGVLTIPAIFNFDDTVKVTLVILGDDVPKYPNISLLENKLFGKHMSRVTDYFGHNLSPLNIFTRARQRFPIYYICRIAKTASDITRKTKELWCSYVGAENITIIQDPQEFVEKIIDCIQKAQVYNSFEPVSTGTKAIATQADGHPSVSVRVSVEASPKWDLKNGYNVTIITQDRTWSKIIFDDSKGVAQEGYVKNRNLVV